MVVESSTLWWPETGGRNEDEGPGISGNLFSVLFALNDDDAVLLDFVIFDCLPCFLLL